MVDQLSNSDPGARIQAADALAAILACSQRTRLPSRHLSARSTTRCLVQGAAAVALGATACGRQKQYRRCCLRSGIRCTRERDAQAATVLGTLEASVRTARIHSSLDREAIAALRWPSKIQNQSYATAVRQLSRAASAASRSLPDIVRLAADIAGRATGDSQGARCYWFAYTRRLRRSLVTRKKIRSVKSDSPHDGASSGLRRRPSILCACLLSRRDEFPTCASRF